MKKTYIVFGLISLLLVACSGQKESVMLESFKINGKTVAIMQDEYKIRDDTVYLSVPALEKHFKLTFKDILPGRQIGICSEDLCVTVEVGDKDKSKAFRENDTYYIPIVQLMHNFGDSAEWDPVKRTLEVTVKKHNSGAKLEMFGKNGSPIESNFSLPGLEGKSKIGL